MAITKRTSSIPALRSVFSDFFENADRLFESEYMNPYWRNNIPAVNIRENENEFTIELAAPGLRKKDFHVEVEDSMLTISVEKEERDEEKDEHYTRREYSYTNFRRSFNLPESANAENIKAKYEDGVLRLSVPKREETRKPRKEISIS